MILLWIVAGSVLGLLVLRELLGTGLTQAFDVTAIRGDRWALLFVCYLLAKSLHELGHGLTCRHFGGECHEIGVIVLVFSPTLYCEVSDSWMMPNKWHRIAIGAAGMWVESILAALALFAWWFSRPGLFHHLCLNVFFVSTITTVIFNLNPLMRYDGYYMLSDLLEIPNLADKSRTMLRNSFAHLCLGIETREDPFMPQRGRGWFVLYAIASTLYRWFVLFGITLFLYTVLKPYELQSIGVTMAWFSMGGIVGNLAFNLYRLMTAPRSEPLSRKRVAGTLLVIAGIIAALMAIPLPWHLEAPFVIEPHDVEYVYAHVPGTLVDAKVRAGDKVKKGTILIQLADPEKERQLLELQTQRSAQQYEIAKQEELQNRPALTHAIEQLQSIDNQISHLEKQIQWLTLEAPIDGRVVDMPRVDEPRSSVDTEELHRWHGSPLDDSNRGCLLEPGPPILCIAPNQKYQALLLVDQQARGDLAEDMKVDIRFDELPALLFRGEIKRIGDRHTEFAHPSLTNKTGGELPTVSDRQGRERLTSVAYEAVVELDSQTELLRAGIRGRSRFYVGHRSTWQWVWRWLRHTFHFRL